MTSYLVELERDRLRVGFNREVLAGGDEIVRDINKRLKEIPISGGEILKIDGPSTVLGTYLFAHHFGHLYGAIAVSDPRLKSYVVVISNSSKYRLGDKIHFDTGEITRYPGDEKDKDSCIAFRVEGEILQIEFTPNSVDGDTIAIDTVKALNRVLDRKELPGGKLLKINGRVSLVSSYIIAHRLAHLYTTIAVYDPRLSKYVVVIDHGGSPVGTVIECSATYTDKPRKVAICGPANTGKTCLRAGLSKILPILEPRSYLISGCPDGDSSFYSRTALRYPEYAEMLRREYRKQFTPEYAEIKAREIGIIQLPLLVFDVGGRITEENRAIMSKATHAVIIASNEKDMEEWENFCRELNLEVVAKLYSYLNLDKEEIYHHYPLIARVRAFDRTSDSSSSPIVRTLAELLADLPLKG